MNGPDAQALIAAAAQQAAEEAVHKTFASLGVDVTSPEGLREFQRTWDWAARYRKLSEKIGSTILLTILAAGTGGVLTMLWSGFQAKLGGGK